MRRQTRIPGNPVEPAVIRHANLGPIRADLVTDVVGDRGNEPGLLLLRGGDRVEVTRTESAGGIGDVTQEESLSLQDPDGLLFEGVEALARDSPKVDLCDVAVRLAVSAELLTTLTAWPT
ncbi:hypothetical protein [Paractinoplanes durhamensis]|uniref:hypothetical protein n=1 Tax=Paractinoplanes durhamensis TaxID=113563 RepID=UPI00363CF024